MHRNRTGNRAQRRGSMKGWAERIAPVGRHLALAVRRQAGDLGYGLNAFREMRSGPGERDLRVGVEATRSGSASVPADHEVRLSATARW